MRAGADGYKGVDDGPRPVSASSPIVAKGCSHLAHLAEGCRWADPRQYGLRVKREILAAAKGV
jgi:hypothetical protein